MADDFVEVGADETLAGIAVRHGLSTGKLRRMNNLSGSAGVFRGQRLRVRPLRVSPVASPAAAAAPRPPASPASSDGGSSSGGGLFTEFSRRFSRRSSSASVGSAGSAGEAGAAGEAEEEAGAVRAWVGGVWASLRERVNAPPPAPPRSRTPSSEPAEGPRLERHDSLAGLADVVGATLLQPSEFLDDALVRGLRRALPGSLRMYRWRLVYSFPVHGASLHALFREGQRCARPTLLFVRTAEGARLGYFAVEQWAPSAAEGYYGSGQSFLFAADAAHPEGVRVFRWTGDNSFFMLAGDDSMAMGGGGAFGMHLNSDISTVTSGACETYASPPLLGEDVHEAQVVACEMWEVTSEFC